MFTELYVKIRIRDQEMNNEIRCTIFPPHFERLQNYTWSRVTEAGTVTEEDTVSFREHQDKVRENLGICVTIFGIIMVAVIVTTLKIIFFDKETYPSVFFTPEEIMAMKNKTVGFTLFTKLRIN